MATLTPTYGAQVDFTITLASLATSATLLAGRESTAVSNEDTDDAIDALLGGKITTGTSPTDNKFIEIWLYAAWDNTPTYPDVMDGTDSAETVTSDEVKQSGLKLFQAIRTDNTSNRTYYFGPHSVAACFGGVMPTDWGVFVTHSTGVNLNSTGGNHQISYWPVKYDST